MSDLSPDPVNAKQLEATAFLVLQARSNSETHFHKLYEHIAPMLYAWVSLRIRQRLQTRLDPQDVIQEVWYRAFKAFTSFDPTKSSFRAWILGIAKNVLLEGLRSFEREELLNLQSDASSRFVPSHAVSQSVTSISQRLARDDVLVEFLAYAESLDSDDRHILIWCALEESSAAEAAVRLGLSVDAVTKRWQRLRVRLAASAWVKTLLLADS